MEWIAKNPSAFIAIIVLIVGNVWSLAVALEQAKRTSKMVEDMEEKFNAHTKEQGIHRTADSEARVSRIEAGINAIGSILSDVKENIGELRAMNKRINN